MKLPLKYAWIVLVIIQVACVIKFFSLSTSGHGLYNRDAFSYDIQWSNVSTSLNPFSEPVLSDPDHDLVRIPFSFPHFLMGVTARIVNPISAYLIWCCLGLLATYFSLVLFASALGFKNEYAHLAALIHYTFFHLLSQLPPLSGNQLRYIIDLLMMKPENIQHFGPLQYPHDIFFYALLYTLLALTLWGVKKVKAGEVVDYKHVLLWGSLCLLLPFNYFYHWFEYAFAMMFIISVGFLLRWWNLSVIRKQHVSSSLIFCIVLVGWGCILLFQNSQLDDEEGYRFALMGGLAEARFLLISSGLLIRIVLWSVFALIVLKINPDSVLLVGFLLGCVLLMNMQMVVGKNIQPGHWSFGVDRVYAWIAILLMAVVTRKYGREWLPKLMVGSVVITFIFFVIQSALSWKHFENLSRWEDTRTEVISFLNTQPTSVVLAPELWIEKDILVHTAHFGFLPRGAQSAVSATEQLQRISHAAFILGYSKEGFVKWLHMRSVRFFGMLYATEKEFSSTYFYDESKRNEVLDFSKGLLPSWDWEIVEKYKASEMMLNKKLDLIVLHTDEVKPVDTGEVIFKNKKYIVYKAVPLKNKEWGDAMPCKEKRYSLDY